MRRQIAMCETNPRPAHAAGRDYFTIETPPVVEKGELLMS
jgi:hypothetical protein